MADSSEEMLNFTTPTLQKLASSVVQNLIVEKTIEHEKLQQLPAELREEMISQLRLVLSPADIRALICSNILCLDLSWCDTVQSKLLHEISLICPKLRNLNVAGTPLDDDSSRAFRNWTSLSSLSVAHTKLSLITLTAIVRAAGNLRQLNLSECPALGDDTVIMILKNVTSLTSLTLCGGRYSDEIFVEVSPILRLQNLNLRGCPNLSDRALLHLVSDNAQTALTRLDLTGIHTTDVGGRAIATLGKSLVSLRMGECDLTPAGVAALATLRKLVDLDLSWCEQVGDEGMAEIARACALRSVKLRMCTSITDRSLMVFGSSLQKVNFSGCSAITDEGLSALIENCRNMRSVDVGWCSSLTESCLIRGVTNWPNLVKYKLQGCKMVTDELLAMIGAVRPGFQLLLLEWVPQVTDKAIRAMAEQCVGVKVKNYYANCFYGSQRSVDEGDEVYS